MPRIRLLLVRHGAVPANRERRFIGDRDETLTAEGRDQVARLVRAFAGLQPAAILSSPLRRARETASVLAAASGVDVRIEPRLREQSFGEWEGRLFGELSSPEVARYFEDPEAAPPGGESLHSVRERVLAVVGELVADPPTGTVWIVSHVGPIKLLLAEALGVSLAVLRRLILDPGTVTAIDWGEPSLVRVVNADGIRDWPIE